MVELAERGAYRGYGTLPADSRRSPRGGPRSSMYSRPETSYHRIKYAHQWGPVLGGRLKQGRTRSQGGGGKSSMEPGRGSRLGPRSPPGVGAPIQARRSQRGKHCWSKPWRGECWGHRTRQRWRRCYRRGGHKMVSIIRRDRGGGSGWSHRTRQRWGRCYRRGRHKRVRIVHKIL